MKNKWMAVLFAGILLAACNGEEADKEPEKEEPTEEVSAQSTESETEAIDEDSPAAIFKEGTYQADVMAVRMRTDMQLKLTAISAQMQHSIQENADWYMETIAGLGEGELLPYDERLGITQEQYEFYLSSDDYMELGKVGESEVTITKTEEGLTIDIPSSGLMKKLTISADGSVAQSDAGELAYDGEIVASENQKITGKWNGHAYLKEELNPSKIAEFSFGELEESGQTIIYLKMMEEGQESKTEIFVF